MTPQTLLSYRLHEIALQLHCRQNFAQGSSQIHILPIVSHGQEAGPLEFLGA